MTRKVYGSILVLIATAALAAKPNPNVPVTTYVNDVNAGGFEYYIQSDGQVGPVNGVTGEYDNNDQNVISVLNANTYNQLPPGDWTLDLLSSSARTMTLTLDSSNEIQSGQAGYTVPPNPPFTGTVRVTAKFEEKCTAIGLDIGTMNVANQTIQCPAIFRFNWNNSTYYRVAMIGAWGNAPESTYVQIQCNKLGANGYCNDWYIDPIPISNGDGTFSPGQAIARLIAVFTKVTGTETNEGDFYMTFHVHVTRP